jgi:hypothetical protein
MAEEVMSQNELAKAFPGSQEIAQQSESIFSSDELQSIETWDDYFNLLEQKEEPVYFAEKVLGDGFAILSTNQKHQLCDIPLAFIEWRFNGGKMGEFVSAKVIAKTGDMPSDLRKVIINDGSTGIYRQLKEFSAKTGKFGGLIVKAGLKESNYDREVTDEKTGQILMVPSTTYYINQAAVN